MTSCSFILIVFCITERAEREMGLTSITLFSENIFQLMSVIVLKPKTVGYPELRGN